MRFLELRPDGVDPSFPLDPRLTLLRGLDPADRVALVGFVHSVAAGETFDWEGTVEVHGVQMALADMLDLIGPTADAAVIVEATTLTAPRGDEFALPEQQALAEARTRRAELETEVTRFAEELSAGGGLRRDMKARLAAADNAIDRTAGPRLDRADGELSRAARAADRPDPWSGTDDPGERTATLQELIEELDARLAALPSGDRAELASAAALCRLVMADGPVADPESVALAEAWLTLHQRLEGLESRVESTGGGTEAVAARLDAARAAARAAEDAAVPRPINDDEMAQLESLHERVVALEGKTGRAMRRGAAMRDFEEAQSELIGALEEIGYPSWAAFRMGNGMVSVRPDLLHAYEVARAELDAAELEWAELMARLERDTDLQSVLNAIEAALEHAVKLLGQDPYEVGESDDPEILADALRARMIDPRSVRIDRDDAFGRLREALRQSEAPAVDQLQGDVGLLGLAETWLRVLAAADAAAVRALRDRERAGAELHELHALGSGTRVDRLHAERAEVRRIEDEVAAARERLFEVADIHVELHLLAASELAVAEQHDAKAALLEAAIDAEQAAGAAALAANAPAAGIADVAARIPRGDAGPIPLVVLMGDAPADVLEPVVGLPADVQIIVVGGDAATEAMVQRLGGACTKGAEGPAFA
ncbi:MAG: hypothetical protein AAGA90_16755 [Actinomycetota bacterium]